MAAVLVMLLGALLFGWLLIAGLLIQDAKYCCNNREWLNFGVVTTALFFIIGVPVTALVALISSL